MTSVIGSYHVVKVCNQEQWCVLFWRALGPPWLITHREHPIAWTVILVIDRNWLRERNWPQPQLLIAGASSYWQLRQGDSLSLPVQGQYGKHRQTLTLKKKGKRKKERGRVREGQREERRKKGWREEWKDFLPVSAEESFQLFLPKSRSHGTSACIWHFTFTGLWDENISHLFLVSPS